MKMGSLRRVLLSAALVGGGRAASTALSGAPFGHALRDDFLFEPNSTQFNHGSYGCVPRAVLREQYSHVEALERFVFNRIDGAWYRDQLLAVRKRIAAYIGAPFEDTVLVDNASNAINVLLRGWDFAPGSVLLDFSTVYGNFRSYYEWLGATRGVATVSVDFDFPVDGPEPILAALRATLASIKASGKTVSVCVVSHVSSAPAIVMPIAQIVAILKAEGIPQIIDGAHALGALDVDLEALGSPDFWFGNAHKWLYAPRSACALYVSKAYQGKYYPEPTVVDSFGDSFADRFVWDGTRDRSAFLAVGDALDFRNSFGEDALLGYIHTLGREGAAAMARVLGTTSLGVGGLLAPPAMQATMHNVIVPTNSTAACGKLGEALVDEYAVQIFALSTKTVPCYLRTHAQIYLEVSDYERLGRIVLTVLGRLERDEPPTGGRAAPLPSLRRGDAA
jgi:selenocysteine lyase/cysteine desulfurase